MRSGDGGSRRRIGREDGHFHSVGALEPWRRGQRREAPPQSLETRASLLNGYYATHQDPGYAARDLKRYLDVTAEDVLATARQVLDPNRRVIMAIVPRTKEPEEKASEGAGQ